MDKTAQTDLQRLARERPQPERLAAQASPAPILAKTGFGSGAGLGGNTAGIASPLRETDVAERTYWETPVTISSLDGMFTLQYLPIRTVKMKDAGGRDVVLEFADPAGTPT